MFLGTRHGIDLSRIVYGTVQIIDPEGQGKLGALPAQHRPVSLQIAEVVHEDPGDRIQAHVLNNGSLRHMAHVVVSVAELKGDETVETSRSVLKCTQPAHVVYPVVIALNMAIQHSCIAVHAQVMCSFMDGKPAIGVHLVGTDLLPDLRMKDLGTPAREGLQPGFLQLLHSLRY